MSKQKKEEGKPYLFVSTNFIVDPKDPELYILCSRCGVRLSRATYKESAHICEPITDAPPPLEN